MTDEFGQTDVPLTPTQARTVELNKANNEILRRLSGMQVSVDPTGKRFEMFVEMMVELGVIPPEYIEKFNLKWVEYFNDYLVNVEVKARAAIEAQIEHARRAQAAAALGIGTQPSGLTVPGNGGGTNRAARRRRG